MKPALIFLSGILRRGAPRLRYLLYTTVPEASR